MQLPKRPHFQIPLPRHSGANLFMSSMTTTKTPLPPVTAVTGTAVITATTAGPPSPPILFSGFLIGCLHKSTIYRLQPSIFPSRHCRISFEVAHKYEANHHSYPAQNNASRSQPIRPAHLLSFSGAAGLRTSRAAGHKNSATAALRKTKPADFA